MSIVPIALAPQALARLMPMYLHLDAMGHVIGCGPTLSKATGGHVVKGADFFQVFHIRRPCNVTTMADLNEKMGQRLALSITSQKNVDFRGIAMPDHEGGVLLNLSFGIGIVEAVRQHALSDADFPPTDLTVELLYLVEAKAVIFEEFQRLNARLEGARSQAEEQALTDTLTGLRNRRALDFALQSACGSRQPFALMHLDLDKFKQVNDTLGHAAGDHVLCEVASVLNSETRAGDTIARVGGDEFVILLPQLVHRDDLEGVASRIIQKLAQPIPYEATSCHIGTSIGLVVSTSYSHLVPDNLLKEADEALYAAKHAGRGQAVFAPSVP